MPEQSIIKKGVILFFLLAIIFSIPFATRGFMGVDTMNWYHTLPLSPLTPPDMVFPIVWTVLYFLMAVSAFLVWNKASPRYFVLQLITNGLWPFLFFYLRKPTAALMDIFVMIVFIVLTMKTFYKASKTASYLFVPLLCWSIFACYLNGYIVFHLIGK